MFRRSHDAESSICLRGFSPKQATSSAAPKWPIDLMQLLQISCHFPSTWQSPYECSGVLLRYCNPVLSLSITDCCPRHLLPAAFHEHTLEPQRNTPPCLARNSFSGVYTNVMPDDGGHSVCDIYRSIAFLEDVYSAQALVFEHLMLSLVNVWGLSDEFKALLC